jgi:hypothetical protein
MLVLVEALLDSAQGFLEKLEASSIQCMQISMDHDSVMGKNLIEEGAAIVAGVLSRMSINHGRTVSNVKALTQLTESVLTYTGWKWRLVPKTARPRLPRILACKSIALLTYNINE